MYPWLFLASPEMQRTKLPLRMVRYEDGALQVFCGTGNERDLDLLCFGPPTSSAHLVAVVNLTLPRFVLVKAYRKTRAFREAFIRDATSRPHFDESSGYAQPLPHT